MKAATLFLAVLVALFVAPMDHVNAHATLLTSEPAPNSFARFPPEELTLRFSEPVDERITGARVLDGAGLEIEPEGPAVMLDEQTLRIPLRRLEPGFYAVVWENVSEIDGHALQGSFPFTVLEPDGAVPAGTPPDLRLEIFDEGPDIDGAAVRWLQLLSFSGMAGLGLLILLGGAKAAVRRALGPPLLVSTGLALTGVILSLVVLRSEFSGLSLTDFLFHSKPGQHGLVRLAVAFVAVALGVTAVSRSSRWTAAVPLAGAAIAVFTLAGTSHAAAGDGWGWGWILDWVHGAAAIVWIGGVVAVAILARRAPAEDIVDGRLLARFAAVASASVLVVVITGTLELFVHLRSPYQLVETRYGVFVLLKIALLMPLLLVAYNNARRSAPASTLAGAERLSRGASVEVLIGVAVMAITSVLTQVTTAASLPPESDARPVVLEAVVDEVTVSLGVDPNRTGFNSFEVDINAPASAGAATAITLVFRYLDDATVGPATLELEPSGEAFGASGPFLPLEGNWLIEATVRFEDRDDLRANLAVRPTGAPFVVRDPRGAWHNPAASLRWNEYGGLVAVFGGLAAYLAVRGRVRVSRFPILAVRFGGLAGLVIGGTLLFGVHTEGGTSGLPVNPVAADRDSVGRGQRLYESACVVCHGTFGVPPGGLDLDPYPLDLQVHVPLHADSVLFGFIHDGIPGSAMRSWGKGDGALTEEEIWHLVNFLRTLRPAEE